MIKNILADLAVAVDVFNGGSDTQSQSLGEGLGVCPQHVVSPQKLAMCRK
jgi:hypothetical protein